ncbi:hypothetical protein ABEW22_19295 [Bacillus velezensis]
MKDKYTRQAFEVEDINRRENCTIVYDPYDQSVELYDTSRRVNLNCFKRELKTKYIRNFPFECNTAYEYFNYLFMKSTSFESDNDIYFIAWVHPDYGYSLEETEPKDINESIEELNKIKTKLKAKLESFTSSIKDNRIKEFLKKHGYISGGSIASLIKGECPKDYDIFIDSKEALKEIIDYYGSLHNSHVSNKNDKLCLLESENDGKLRLGLTREFVKSFEDNDEMLPIVFSQRAITFPSQIQLIINNGESPLETINKFDFIHTMSFYNPSEDKFFIKEESLKAIKQNRLIYNLQGTNPIGSAKRLLRFVKRGWEIDNKEHMKLMLNINKINDKNTLLEEMGEYIF